MYGYHGMCMRTGTHVLYTFARVCIKGENSGNMGKIQKKDSPFRIFFPRCVTRSDFSIGPGSPITTTTTTTNFIQYSDGRLQEVCIKGNCRKRAQAT